MWLIAVFSFSVLMLAAQVDGQNGQCPDRYTRFSQHHTYCAPVNNSCTIVKTGVNRSERDLILRMHNEYRSKVAVGNEDRAGGLPEAAKMLEMVWDDEMASIAQKLTETCHYGHDCGECKMTPVFSAGQNIGLRWVTGGDPPSIDWPEFLTALYEEVPRFHKSKINPFVPGPEGQDVQYGHFTQMVWDTTWTVGCGLSQFYAEGAGYTYYACNYGPGGNIEDGAMYETGSYCSKCPSNTCCGSFCSNYQGLCKVVSENMPPEGSAAEPGSVFFCNFMNQDDCRFSVSGASDWKLFQSRGNNYARITLSGGQSTTITFTKPFRVSSGNLCINLQFRRQPALAGQNYAISTSGKLKSGSGMVWTLSYSSPSSSSSWVNFNYVRGGRMAVSANTDFEYSLTFSVASGASDQIVEIRKIVGQQC